MRYWSFYLVDDLQLSKSLARKISFQCVHTGMYTFRGYLDFVKVRNNLGTALPILC